MAKANNFSFTLHRQRRTLFILKDSHDTYRHEQLIVLDVLGWVLNSNTIFRQQIMCVIFGYFETIDGKNLQIGLW